MRLRAVIGKFLQVIFGYSDCKKVVLLPRRRCADALTLSKKPTKVTKFANANASMDISPTRRQPLQQ